MTDREQEVLNLLRAHDGLRSREVADMLCVRMSTASCHLRALRLAGEAHCHGRNGQVTRWYAGPEPRQEKPMRKFPSVWAYGAAGGD